ncbi:MAG: radical SAM protein [Anaerolineae bacterium]|nr:radical SAM protein [Gemmatimonadaceae bacterium]
MITRPLNIGFELSNLCNLHCTHCIRGSHQKTLEHLDLSLFTRILDQANTLFNPVAVVFTGGEPLASALFPQAVEHLARRGMRYRFVTNGWLIPRHLPLLLRHKPMFVRISLSGASERTHDTQRGKSSFRRALVGAAVLLSKGIRAEMSMVVTRDSRFELADAVRLANEIGVAEFHFILPQPTPETALDGSDLSPSEWNTVTREIHVLAAQSAVPIGLDYGTFAPHPRPACNTMAQRQIYVDARGRVPFCCQLSRYGTGPEPILGDLNSESLATVFARGETTYSDFAAETSRLYQIGQRDAVDDYPCMSCARRNGRTAFMADFPTHAWAALGHLPA